jgi:hypothetical protein
LLQKKERSKKLQAALATAPIITIITATIIATITAILKPAQSAEGAC